MARKEQSTVPVEIGDADAGAEFQDQMMGIDAKLQAEYEGNNDHAEPREQQFEQPVRRDGEDGRNCGIEMQFEGNRPGRAKVPVRICPREDEAKVERRTFLRRQIDPGLAGERREQHKPVDRINSKRSSEDEAQRVAVRRRRGCDDEAGNDKEDVDAACKNREDAFGNARAYHVGSRADCVSADHRQRSDAAHCLYTREDAQNAPAQSITS